VIPQDEVLPWPGYFISWVTFTSRSTLSNSSRGNTRTVIAVAVIPVFVLHRIAPRYRYTGSGIGC